MLFLKKKGLKKNMLKIYESENFPHLITIEYNGKSYSVNSFILTNIHYFKGFRIDQNNRRRVWRNKQLRKKYWWWPKDSWADDDYTWYRPKVRFDHGDDSSVNIYFDSNAKAKAFVEEVWDYFYSKEGFTFKD